MALLAAVRVVAWVQLPERVVCTVLVLAELVHSVLALVRVLVVVPLLQALAQSAEVRVELA